MISPSPGRVPHDSSSSMRTFEIGSPIVPSLRCPGRLNATIGDAKIWIDYGRPAKRGREVWGKLVPYDTTWRFGAKAVHTRW